MTLEVPFIRFVVAPLLTAFIAAGCTNAGQPPPREQAARLLVETPPLPMEWEVRQPPEGEPSGSRELDWGLAIDARETSVDIDCDDSGRELVRMWSADEGSSLVLQHACVYPSVEDAVEGFGSRQFIDTAGEDYFNLVYPERVPGGSAAIAPSTGAVPELRADDWQLACAEGDARDICAVWLFRARYGRAIVGLSYTASGGGIGMRAFSELVQSVDKVASDSSV